MREARALALAAGVDARTHGGAAAAGPWRVARVERPYPIGCALDGSCPQLDAVAPYVTWLVEAAAVASETHGEDAE